MTEALKLPYSVQGRGTVESIGNHFYRVCGPAGCTVVMGLSNALYLSRNVPESAPPPGGFFLGFFDEVDAASGALSNWSWDSDGDHGAASAVS